MMASALFALHADGWQTAAKAREIAVLYLAGAFVAFLPALWLGRLLSVGGKREAAFAALFLSLGVMTIGLTATFYALDYRSYYTEWHAPAFSVTWAFQFVFTVAGALYQFAVLGLRLYLPFGLLALFAAALWFARLPR